MMKLALIALLIALLLAPACSQVRASEQREWTVLVYIVADNDLDEFAPLDFDEIAKVGSNDRVAVVAQIDRSEHARDFTTTRRFLIKKGMHISDAPVADIGEANMGRPETLTDFLVWGQEQYPAKRYALIIWNHGSGWRNLTL